MLWCVVSMTDLEALCSVSRPDWLTVEMRITYGFL